MKLKLVLGLILVCAYADLLAGTKNDPHAPITHCYHWLNEASRSYLSFKYTFAKSNGNELTFITSAGTSNGSIAGPGLYCAKTPADSYSYGDRVIRVNFVEDVVLLDEPAGIQYCGTNGETSRNSPTCAAKTWDVKFYSGGGVGNFAWYVIQNPMAIDTWSANSDQVEEDLKINMSDGGAGYQAHAVQTLKLIALERSVMGKQTFQSINARASIIDIILKDPKKLDSIPPLNIVSRVLLDSSDKLTPFEKTEIYNRFIRRSLGSNDTELSEITTLLTRGDEIRAIIEQSVLEGLRAPAKLNPLILLGVISQAPETFKNITTQTHQSLIERVLSNNDLMTQLAKSNIVFSDRIQTVGRSVINAKVATSDLKNNSLQMIPSTMRFFANENELPRLRAQLKNKFFSQKKEFLGLKVGSEEFYFKNAADIKAQCVVALSLHTGSTDEGLKFIFKNQDLTMGKISDLNACDRISSLHSEITQNNYLSATSDLYVVVGRFEDIPFAFVGFFQDDILKQCEGNSSSFSGRTDIDDVYVSINGGTEIRNYNSKSYWKTKEEVCGAVMIAIGSTIITRAEMEFRKKIKAITDKSQQLKKSNPNGFLVEGNIEGVNFAFFGGNLEEVQNECVSFHPNLPNPTYIDEIHWKIDNMDLTRRYNSASYWKTADELCTILSDAISSYVPTKRGLQRNSLSAKWLSSKQSAPNGFLVKGKIENQGFAFYAHLREDLMTQCREFYDYLDATTHVRQISVGVNDGAEIQHVNYNRYWDSKERVCDFIDRAISTSVPAARDAGLNLKRLEMINNSLALEKQNSSEDVLSVKGTIQTFNYHFFGTTTTEIKDQCKEFFRYLPNTSILDEMTVSLYESKPQRFTSRHYLDTDEKLCNELIKNLSPMVVSPQERAQRARVAAFQGVLAQERAQYLSGRHPFRVSGTTGNFAYYFYGDNLEDIEKQCQEYETQYPEFEIVSRVSFRFQLENQLWIPHSGQAKNICAVLRPYLEINVPTEEEVNFLVDGGDSIKLRVNPKSIYQGRMKLHHRFLPFHVKDAGGIKNQCKDYFPHLRMDTKPASVLYQINGSEPKRASLEVKSLNAADFCKSVEKVFKAEFDRLKKANSSRR